MHPVPLVAPDKNRAHIINIHISIEDLQISDHSGIFFNLSWPTGSPSSKMLTQRCITNQAAIDQLSLVFYPSPFNEVTEAEVLVF